MMGEMCKGMCPVHKAAWVLVIVGALNWLLVGVFQWDLVAAIFGGMGSVLARIVYILVGLSGVAMLGMCGCKMCKMSGGMMKK